MLKVLSVPNKQSKPFHSAIDSIRLRKVMYGGIFQKFFRNILMMFSSITLMTFYLIFATDCTEATRCFKNKEFGDRGGNTYYCEDPNKPSCCEENSIFTCCEDKSTRNFKEQLTLWGSVAAAVIVIAGIMIYFFKDMSCCSDDRPLSERCCQCCRARDENDLTALTEERDVMQQERSPWPTSLYRSSPYYQSSPPFPPPKC